MRVAIQRDETARWADTAVNTTTRRQGVVRFCRGWVGTRRVAFRYVSSSPPFRTVLAAFTAHGSTPLVNLHSKDHEASVSISTAFTDAFLCALSSFTSIPSNAGTACAFAGSLVRDLLFVLLRPKGKGPSPSVRILVCAAFPCSAYYAPSDSS